MGLADGKAWEDEFGYKSDEPCIVCGKHNNNQSEPRFGYTVCEEHQNIPPSDIQKYCRW